MNLIKLYVLLVAFLLSLPAYSAESNTAKLFSKAEQVKLHNPNEFSAILTEIKNQKLSRNESIHLIYLEGFHAQFIGNHDLAFKKYQEALSANGSIEIRYKTIIALANLMSVKRNLSDAFNYMFQAMSLLPQISDPQLRSMVKIQELYAYRGLEFFDDVLAISLQLIAENVEGRPLCIAWFYHDLSIQQLKPSTLQLDKVNEHINYCERINEPLLSLFGYTIVAQHFLDNNDFHSANETINKHLASVEKFNFTHLLGRYYFIQASALVGLNKPNEAILVLEKLFAVSKQLESSAPLADGYKLRSELAENENNLKEALEYHKKYLKNELLYKNSLSAQQTAFHLAKGELHSKNQQIDLLEKDNELLGLQQELAISTSQRNQLLIFVLIVCLLITSFFAVKTLRSKTKYRLLAENDNLTGISNRYHFTDKVRTTLEQSSKTAQIDSFIIFDLDLFKQINDLHGHLTGDWVLQAVVEHSRQFVRNLDVFGRIGGEEFAIYLPACTAEKAALLAEILRDAISQIDCSGSGHPIRVTASFGVTSTDRSGYQLKHLFRDADQALYYSKEHGRNQVTLFNDNAGN